MKVLAVDDSELMHKRSSKWSRTCRKAASR